MNDLHPPGEKIVQSNRGAFWTAHVEKADALGGQSSKTERALVKHFGFLTTLRSYLPNAKLLHLGIVD